MRAPDRPRVDLIGRPIDALPEPAGGFAVRKVDDDMGTKATRNGIYTLNGHPYVMQAGQILPDGAVIEEPASTPNTVVDMETEAPESEERAKPAPQNRAKKSAPENR